MLDIYIGFDLQPGAVANQRIVWTRTENRHIFISLFVKIIGEDDPSNCMALALDMWCYGFGFCDFIIYILNKSLTVSKYRYIGETMKHI